MAAGHAFQMRRLLNKTSQILGSLDRLTIKAEFGIEEMFSMHKRKLRDEFSGKERNPKQQKHDDTDSDRTRKVNTNELPSNGTVKYYVPGPKSSPSKSAKLASLVDALNDVLEEGSMDEMLGYIGEETFSRCLGLRTSLRESQVLSDPALQTQQTSRPESHDPPNVAKHFSGLSLTPWRSSEIRPAGDFPPLPEVLDPTLEAAVFIHQGFSDGSPTSFSYERLEWVGDAYLELGATAFISQTFPWHSPGKWAQLRELLVKNITLAEFSRRYGFLERAKLPADFTAQGKHPASKEEVTKVLGDIFEAYVAAVILSDPAHGLARAMDWVKDLWGQVIAKEIKKEEVSGIKEPSPLWKLRGAVAVVDQPEQKKRILNHKEQLSVAIATKGVKISYKDIGTPRKDPKTKLAVYTVGVYLSGYGETDKLLGTGSAFGKKEAGTKAAEMALGNTKLLKVYTEKKKLAMEQLEREKEALNAVGAI